MTFQTPGKRIKVEPVPKEVPVQPVPAKAPEKVPEKV